MSSITGLFPGVEAVAVFTAATIGALAVRHLALWALGRSGCEQSFTYVICRSIRWPSLVLCLLIGAYSTIYLDLAHLSARSNTFVLKILHATLIVAATLVVARLAQLSTEYLLRQNKLLIPGSGAVLALIRVTVWGIGLLVLLRGLGVAITPILTALGIGGLAVSLALQDTLANFFAGIQIVVDKPIELGDRVRLESGQEGEVESIGWRSTRLRTETSDLVVIPNTKLVQSVVYNYRKAQTAHSGSATFNEALQKRRSA
jgi:small-conductance mechanosensitive channel